jgi:DNA replication and repair protein RecF
MKINWLKLTNYRNHEKYTINFDSNLTLIIGDNGSGKTNILEAIGMISTTKPFRGEYDQEIITHTKDFSRLDAEIEHEDITSLEMILTKSLLTENGSTKKVKINKTPKTLQKFAGTLKTVLFSPEDIQVITGSPSARRHFIDNIFAQISMPYKKALSNYTKALRQRNKLLEIIFETSSGQDQLDFWNNVLLENGKVIQTERKNLFKFLETKMSEYEERLNKTPSAYHIIYHLNEVTPERQAAYKEKELYARTTLIGPHRDDFEIRLGDKNIAHFGSRGQQRTAVLALKLSEIDFIQHATAETPVLLLDDIFSELDNKHKSAVIETIKDKQTIITGAEMHPVLEMLNIKGIINLGK